MNCYVNPTVEFENKYYKKFYQSNVLSPDEYLIKVPDDNTLPISNLSKNKKTKRFPVGGFDPIKNILDKFGNVDVRNCNNTSSVGTQIYSIFHLIMTMIAIYLSHRCNTEFNIVTFLMAWCCPYAYIIYILATQGTCGIFNK